MPFDGKAKWIWHKDGIEGKPDLVSPFKTVYFRRKFNVPQEGLHLRVNVSADSKYILYLNGKRVSWGPAKGDLVHQFYDTLVLDGLLQKGANVLAAIAVSYAGVWPTYGGVGGPNSIMSATGAFVLEGSLMNDDRDVIEVLDSDKDWRALNDRAYGHVPVNTGIVGMGEVFDGREYPWGWQEAEYDDSWWDFAGVLGKGVCPCNATDTPLPYRLIPRMIDYLEEKDMQFAEIYRRQNVDDMRVMPHSKASFILDAGMLTTGFPVIQVRGGREAKIRLTYSEALYVDGQKIPYHLPDKGDVEGVFDTVISSGNVTYYEPVLWKTFRYIKVEIETFDEELFIEDVYYRFISYPLSEIAKYQSSDPLHRKMWDMSWRTVRLCTHETFEDCPYYEQMQYAGDSQVVSLVAGYVSGDWSLTKQAILHFDWSRDYEGIPKSRYPSMVPQKIPSWSILWVVMVSDYYLHTADRETTEQCLEGISTTLRWFEKYLNQSYLLERLPYWTVVDWVKEWKHPSGCPPGAAGGVTALISLQYAYALARAAGLFGEFGRENEAHHFMNIRNKIIEEVRRSCWSEEHKLYRDRPGYNEFSELGNAWAILSEAATAQQAKAITSQIGTNPIIAQSTLYGRFYVFRALSKAGSYDDVVPRLFTMWHNMMYTDLTTWPEDPYFARSYCHAWSSTPIYEFLAEILGVKPLKPGFEEVLVRPHVLNLTHAAGSVPTMYGIIKVAWQIVDGRFLISAELPDGVRGKIVLPNGEELLLEGRKQLSCDGL